MKYDRIVRSLTQVISVLQRGNKPNRYLQKNSRQNLKLHKMKKVITSIFLLVLSISFGQQASGCGSLNWPSIVTSTGSIFNVPAGTGAGWIYFWVVTPSANLQIVSGQGTPNAIIKGTAGTSGQVYVTKYKDGILACADMKNITIVTDCDIKQKGIFQLNVLGNENVKFYTMPSILSGGLNNFNYLWTFVHQDGTITTSTDREPYIPIDCSNPVVDSNVIITSIICTRTIIKDWATGVCGTLGFERTENVIEVFPNPTTSKVQFVGTNLSKLKISIFDITGAEVLKNSKLDQEISLDNLNNGLLFYVITDENGFKQEGKIIKK